MGEQNNRKAFESTVRNMMNRFGVEAKMDEFSFNDKDNLALSILGHFEPQIMRLLRSEFSIDKVGIIMAHGRGHAPMGDYLGRYQTFSKRSLHETSMPRLREQRMNNFHNNEFRLYLEAMLVIVDEMALVIWSKLWIDSLKKSAKEQVRARL